MSESKVCTRCKQEKDLSAFASKGKEYWCRFCRTEVHKEWYAKNKEKRGEQIKAWQAKWRNSEIGKASHRNSCLLYTSDAADDLLCVDLGGRRIIKKKKKI